MRIKLVLCGQPIGSSCSTKVQWFKQWDYLSTTLRIFVESQEALFVSLNVSLNIIPTQKALSHLKSSTINCWKDYFVDQYGDMSKVGWQHPELSKQHENVARFWTFCLENSKSVPCLSRLHTGLSANHEIIGNEGIISRAFHHILPKPADSS